VAPVIRETAATAGDPSEAALEHAR